MRKKFSIIFLAVVMSFSFIVNAFAASAIDPVWDRPHGAPTERIRVHVTP